MENHIEVEEKKQDKGFTLVELLIVIVILGILATVTVFAVRGITDKSQENACKVERRTLETAIEAYYADNGQVDPPNEAALTLNSAYLKSAPDATKWTFYAAGADSDPVTAGVQAGATAGYFATPAGACVGF
jgi:general secretion pathway protein G